VYENLKHFYHTCPFTEMSAWWRLLVTETCSKLYIVEQIVVFWLNDISVNTYIGLTVILIVSIISKCPVISPLIPNLHNTLTSAYDSCIGRSTLFTQRQGVRLVKCLPLQTIQPEFPAVLPIAKLLYWLSPPGNFKIN
jgi:hypothetical protein